MNPLYKKPFLRRLCFSIHVTYTGRGGWSHNYGAAHSVTLRDIVDFELYKSYDAARNILKACRLRFPCTWIINTNALRITWIATAVFDPDTLLQVAKQLEKERQRRLDSQPPFPIKLTSYYLVSYTNIML